MIELKHPIRWFFRLQRHARVIITSEHESATIDATGAIRSLESGYVELPAEQVNELWNEESLERLAGGYWRFITHVTLGLVRVRYLKHGRQLVLIAWPLVLLSFEEPSYSGTRKRGMVSWRIKSGLLTTQQTGTLEIVVLREPSEQAGYERLLLESKIKNYYPRLALLLGKSIYLQTQARLHTAISNGYIRSLGRLKLHKSLIGHFATTPNKPPNPLRRFLTESRWIWIVCLLKLVRLLRRR